jgi:hypothetical protein
MNEEFPNDPYTHQHRQNLFAGEIQRVIRRHVEYPASISWEEAVELLRQLANQLEWRNTEWPAEPEYGPDYDPHE